MDPAWADAVLSLAVGIGLAAAAGLRVFLPLLVLGGAARFGWVPLAGGFEWLASGPGMAALSVATVLEVGAYYIPWVDNLLDIVAGPMAIMAGVIATAAVVTDLPPPLRWAAAIIAGGGTAGLVQALTSLVRLKSTAATAGAANPIVATFELVGSLVTSVVVIALPLAVIAVFAGLWLLVRRARRMRVARA